MRKLLVIILLFISCAHKAKNKTVDTSHDEPIGDVTTITDKTINDTAFLLRETSKIYYHAVYIERNRQSTYYKWLLDFKFDSTENAEFKESNEYLKQKHPAPFKKYDLSDLPKEWMPIYSYKKKYYIYAPSEPGEMARRTITDSTLIYWFGDGPAAEPFKSVKKIDDHTWFFKTDHFYTGPADDTLIIHMIDQKNKIAVFEDSSAPKGFRYSLYISKDNAKSFDMVVNYCNEGKTTEFLFDKIDYEALLKNQ